MKTLGLALVSLFLSTSAFAANVKGSCNLVNALGAARMELDGNAGEIRGINGVSPIFDIREQESPMPAVRMLEIGYNSRLGNSFGGGHDARVILAIAASPGTMLMGVNYQGMIMLPLGVPALSFPGPFSYSAGGWLNPFGPFIPTIVPAGFAPVAAAYCSLR